MFEKMFVERLRTCFEALFGEEHSHFCKQWVKKKCVRCRTHFSSDM